MTATENTVAARRKEMEVIVAKQKLKLPFPFGGLRIIHHNDGYRIDQ